jgi:hypothetical protein
MLYVKSRNSDIAVALVINHSRSLVQGYFHNHDVLDFDTGLSVIETVRYDGNPNATVKTIVGLIDNHGLVQSPHQPSFDVKYEDDQEEETQTWYASYQRNQVRILHVPSHMTLSDNGSDINYKDNNPKLKMANEIEYSENYISVVRAIFETENIPSDTLSEKLDKEEVKMQVEEGNIDEAIKTIQNTMADLDNRLERLKQEQIELMNKKMAISEALGNIIK